ncbi:MAG TPA: winged helix-turn-helix domain-containing protein [Candidatus Binatia bacterium]|nr:winged helix-turn-helix domain-containing protein [Candidatus Binatia bacterium]
MASAGSNRRISTGLYDIDLGCPELRKGGVRVPLQEQPFRVLSLLLEHPGEVVTREELQTRLWPADTYVAFDEGINTAIRKLRAAFGDSADNPRFIETLPRRGYRFIAPVNEVPRPEVARGMGVEPTTKMTDVSSPAEVHREATERESHHTSSESRIRPRTWKFLTGAALGMLLVAAGAIYFARSSGPTTAVPTRRIMLAILPFQNLSNDPNEEYFSDGLTEETITDLGELSPEQLGVIARTSAMAYKRTDKTVSQIGRELGVDYILEGSVRREGGRARVSAQLIRVSDQTHLWAQTYDRELHSVLEIENDLGQAIAREVQASLTPQRQSALARQRHVDPEAYDLYLRGRYYWNERTPSGIKESIEYFQRATAKDPDFALAYAGLADAYNISNIVGLYSPKESLPHSAEAAKRAIELDPSLAEPHAALGMEKSHYEFDFPGAEKEFRKALELNPNSAYAHLFYSNCYLLPMGREAEAVAENQKALTLDPLSLPINNFMAVTYGFLGDYERSYKQFQHTIEMDPRFPLAHAYFAGLLFPMGKFDEAIEENEKAAVLMGESPEKAAADAAEMRATFKSGGEKGLWQLDLERTLRQFRGKDQSVLASSLAAAYARTGELDKAFEWLDKAYDERDGQDITLVKYDPSYKNLRADPRYAAFQKRMGLPP